MISPLRIFFVLMFFHAIASAQIVANRDVANLPQGQGSVTLNPTNNDVFSGNISRFIQVNPAYGFASFDALGNMIYTQTKDTCAVADSLQYRICLSPTQCATAWVVINITCTGYEMRANDDNFLAFENEVSSFNFTENDKTPFTIFSIITSPQYGQILSASVTEVLYRPSQCGKTDTIEYILCNDVKCDTAKVLIKLNDCTQEKKLQIYNAVSPNGDGKNDVFFISELEDFPENKLQILNRWGQLVFEMNNYDNSWNGKNKSGKDLEDGVYYYILDLGASNSTVTDKRLFKGSIMLMR